MATSENQPEKSDPDVAAPAADESPVSASTKSAMAAALQRKQAGGTGFGSHMDGQAKVDGATENHKATRTFRRKSG